MKTWGLVILFIIIAIIVGQEGNHIVGVKNPDKTINIVETEGGDPVNGESLEIQMDNEKKNVVFKFKNYRTIWKTQGYKITGIKNSFEDLLFSSPENSDLRREPIISSVARILGNVEFKVDEKNCNFLKVSKMNVNCEPLEGEFLAQTMVHAVRMNLVRVATGSYSGSVLNQFGAVVKDSFTTMSIVVFFPKTNSTYLLRIFSDIK